jgi:hypothetical protein
MQQPLTKQILITSIELASLCDSGTIIRKAFILFGNSKPFKISLKWRSICFILAQIWFQSSGFWPWVALSKMEEESVLQ